MSRNTNAGNPYEDIIHLPRPVSEKRPHMSLLDRAAQFSPFSALTGYEDTVEETARLTDRRKELDEYERTLLDERFRWLQSRPQEDAEVTIVYFKPDARKDGGAYVTVTGKIKKIDFAKQYIWMTGGERIPFQAVTNLEGAVFRKEKLFFEEPEQE